MAFGMPTAKVMYITEDQGLAFFSLTLPNEDIRDRIADVLGAMLRINHPVIAPAHVIRLGRVCVFVQLASPLADYRVIERLVGVLACQHHLALHTTTSTVDELEVKEPQL